MEQRNLFMCLDLVEPATSISYRATTPAGEGEGRASAEVKMSTKFMCHNIYIEASKHSNIVQK